MVDDYGFDGAFSGVEMEAKLFFEGREDVWSIVVGSMLGVVGHRIWARTFVAGRGHGYVGVLRAEGDQDD